MKIRNIFILLLGMMMAACSTDTECRQDADIYMNVVFEGDSLRLNADSTEYEHVRFTSLRGMRINGVGRDSLITDGSSLLSKAQMPLRPDTTITDYAFAYNGKQDTVRIFHTNDMNFISLACGCFVYHTIDSIYHSTRFIDSVVILNTAVTTKTDNHIRIYFRKE